MSSFSERDAKNELAMSGRLDRMLNSGSMEAAAAITDAETRFDQMQLEAANVVGGGRVGRALQERRKSPATVDVAALRMGPELASRHVLDRTPRLS